MWKFTFKKNKIVQLIGISLCVVAVVGIIASVAVIPSKYSVFHKQVELISAPSYSSVSVSVDAKDTAASSIQPESKTTAKVIAEQNTKNTKVPPYFNRRQFNPGAYKNGVDFEHDRLHQSNGFNGEPNKVISTIQYDRENLLKKSQYIDIPSLGQTNIILSSRSKVNETDELIQTSFRFDGARGGLTVLSLNDEIKKMTVFNVDDSRIFIGYPNKTQANETQIEFIESNINEHICHQYESEKQSLLAALSSPIEDSYIPDINDTPPSFAEVSNLQSKPNTPNILFLDYYGGIVSGTSWNSLYNNDEDIEYLPFDLDDDTTSFSEVERQRMYMAWAEIAEDFSPFEINITTSAQIYNSTPENLRARIISTNSREWLGDLSATGGVAFVNRFGVGRANTGWAFNRGINALGLTQSHEAGHIIGLQHDGTSNASYYGGHGNWGSIMGGPFGRDFTHWNDGSYNDANNPQNDIAIMTNVLGLSTDDIGNSNATAETLNETSVVGIITPQGSTNIIDKDVYSFTLNSTRGVNINVRTLLNGDIPGNLGMNLSAKIALKASNGTLISEKIPTSDSVSNDFEYLGNLAPGTYFLTIEPQSYDSNLSTGFNEYGNGGYYQINSQLDLPIIPYPDLAVSSLSLSDTDVFTGSSITINAIAQNIGDAEAESTTLRYYRSIDPTIAINDTQIGTDVITILPANGTNNESITIIAPSTGGTYYYGACIDSVTDESTTNNNCSTGIEVTVNSPPDLMINAFSTNTQNVLTGSLITLNASARNIGEATSGSSTIRYYRSTNATIDTNDTQVGTDAVSSLATNDTSDQATNVTVPNTGGTYYYGACIDTVSDETITGNNCSSSVAVTVVAPAPDLIIPNFSSNKSSLISGETLLLSATTSNVGEASSGTSTLRYYRSNDSNITNNDTALDTDFISGLNINATENDSITIEVAVPYPYKSFTYYFGACADTVADETATSNNCSASVAVTVVSPPDLTVASVSTNTTTINAGEPISLSVLTRNIGGFAAVSSSLRYYRSNNSTISSSDTEIGTDAVNGLNVNAQESNSISISAPNTAGTYYYGACVDTVTDETVTNNNCSSTSVAVTVVVPAPDLLVPNFSTNKATVISGKAIVLSATTSNTGEASSAASTLRYYRSNDATITTNDTPLGTDSVSSLNINATENDSLSSNTPNATGTFYYGACIDTVANEETTNNNCSTAIEVTVVSPPDLTISTFSTSSQQVLPGSSITLNTSAKNIGDTTANSSTLRYFRSINAVIETNDTQIGTDAVASLSTNASNNESITINAPTTAGTYYYGACIDTVTDETTTNNNCSTSIAVTVGNFPDLTIDNFSTSATTVTVGESFTLSNTTKNIGGFPTSSSTLRYFRSNDSMITNNDIALGTDFVSGLNANAVENDSISTNAPSSSGTYYYGTCVDAVNNETVTNNNCSIGVAVNVVGLQDLIVPSISADTNTVIIGKIINLSATTKNIGGSTSDATQLRYRQSNDSTITNSDILVSSDNIASLSSNAEENDTTSFRAPNTTGTYYYGACTDVIPGETNTNNNCSSSVAINVVTAPDLRVSSISSNIDTVMVGKPINLTAISKNLGGFTSGESTTLRYYRSINSIIDTNDIQLGTDTVNALNSNDEEPDSVNINAENTPGTYYYGACLETVTNETVTNNNCSNSVTVNAVSPPDLIIDSFTPSTSTITAGTQLTLSATTKNNGGYVATASNLRYYRSTDNVITVNDAQVGTDTIAALNSTAAESDSITITVPTVAGTYYYGACVDRVSDESAGNNNCSNGIAVTVSEQTFPDLLTENLNVNKIRLTTNSPLDIGVTVRNGGSEAASASSVKFYISSDNVISVDDDEEASFNISALGINNSVIESTTVTSPNVAGDYYIGTCVAEDANEQDINNNCSVGVLVEVVQGYEADEYEIDNSAEQSKTISNGDTQIHNIHTLDDEDWVKFSIDKDVKDLSIIIDSLNGDNIEFELMDESFNSLGVITDTNLYNFQIAELEAGTYYVHIKTVDGDNAIENYEISLSYKEIDDDMCFPIKAKNGNVIVICL